MTQRPGLIGQHNIDPDNIRLGGGANQIKKSRKIEHGAAEGDSCLKNKGWPDAMDQLLIQLQIKRTLGNRIAKKFVLEVGIRRVIPEKMEAGRSDTVC
jgi:hypothetical protein